MPYSTPKAKSKSSSGNKSNVSNNEVMYQFEQKANNVNTMKYKKLVVPTRMRSIYWKFFGFPATSDGVILTRAKIVCTLCKKQIMYNRNTSNLRTHLQSKHKQTIMNIEPLPQQTKRKSISNTSGENETLFTYSTEEDGTVEICDEIGVRISTRDCEDPSNSVQLLLDETAGIIEEAASDSSNIAVIFPNDEEMHEYTGRESVSDVVLDFLITDLQSPNIIEGKGFQRMIGALRSPCEISTKQKFIDEVIPKMYDSYKYAMLDSISNSAGNLALSIEQWTNNSSVTYISFYIHYQQTGGSLLITRMLASIYCTNLETVDDWTIIIDKLFLEWNISTEYVRAVVSSFSNHELKRCLQKKNIIMIPCFLYVLQNACHNLCFEHQEVSSILVKCRALIAYIHQNNKNNSDFQNYSNDDDVILMTDYQDVWVSTYCMLKGILVRRVLISSLFSDFEETITTNLLKLTDDEWNIIDDVIQILEPLKIIVTTLNEEKSPLISLLKPIIWQVTNSHFEIKSSDSQLASEIKIRMKEFLVKCYSGETISSMLQIATTLDPRFKSFLQDHEQVETDQRIMELLTELIVTEGVKLPESPCDSKEFNKKHNRQSGINMLLGNICITKTSMPIEERAKVDIIQYQSENCATLEDCPLDWWQNTSVKCPNLSRLAYRYNCIPAIAIPTKHISVHNRILYNIKRSVLSCDIVDKFLFLHVNRPLFTTN